MDKAENFLNNLTLNEQMAFLAHMFQKEVNANIPTVYNLDKWNLVIDYYLNDISDSNMLYEALFRAGEQFPDEFDILVRSIWAEMAEAPEEALDTCLYLKENCSSKYELAILEFLTGKVYLELSDINNAIICFKQSLKIAEHEYIHIEISEAYIGLSDLDTAFSHLCSALEICRKKTNQKYYQTFGICYSTLPNTNIACKLTDNLARICKARKEYLPFVTEQLEELVNTDPMNWSYWNVLAAFHFSAKNYGQALEAYDYCLSIDSENEYVLLKKADVYRQTGDRTKLVGCLQEVCNIVENKTKSSKVKSDYFFSYIDLQKSYKELSDIFFMNSEYEKCIDICKKMLEVNASIPLLDDTVSKRSDIYITMSDCYFNLNDYGKAVDFSLEALDLAPDSSECQVHLIRLLYETGNKDLAENTFINLYEKYNQDDDEDNIISRYGLLNEWLNILAFDRRYLEILTLFDNAETEFHRMKYSLLSEEVQESYFTLQCTFIDIFCQEEQLHERVMKLIYGIVCNTNYTIRDILKKTMLLEGQPSIMDEINGLTNEINEDE